MKRKLSDTTEVLTIALLIVCVTSAVCLVISQLHHLFQ